MILTAMTASNKRASLLSTSNMTDNKLMLAKNNGNEASDCKAVITFIWSPTLITEDVAEDKHASVNLKYGGMDACVGPKASRGSKRI